MNTHNFLDSDSVIIILGAGASVDAKIPHASKMVENLEKILNNEEYKKEKDLYLLLKSSIILQRGLKSFNPTKLVSIEEILNVIESLKQKQENILYPFIGNWANHLIKTSGDDFSIVDNLDRLIRSSLFGWVTPQNYIHSKYYNKIADLSKQLSFPIRIFSLNYDICVEKAFEKTSCILETGCDKESYLWSYERFDLPPSENVDAYLYKLHGSIDWTRNESGELLKSDSQHSNNPEVIFGTTMKMRSLDPYLFSLYELRRYSLHKNLKFIIIIGYSFSDDHINKLIQQSLLKNNLLKLIIVDLYADNDFKDKVNSSMSDGKSNLVQDTFIYEEKRAKDFFESLNKDYLLQYLENDDLPF